MSEDLQIDEPATPYHPEEMKAVWDVRLGKNMTIHATARWTPAGVVAAGVTTSAVLLAVAALVRACRTPR
ncbi:hypothetical protein NVS89_08190 [Ancylobacter sp. MQZ15Z-1]|uniref:Uncharacterized protein n=1 Tax=Ancylobacter mangrovi TaxID=2972472 RepID=A0A9X2PAE8_9HYPH|nr:hypothetical protein [Ancylobacter mangrovi]MCS0495074.1 hypothetical protein [Ancylobacter mangrovi]